MRYGPPRHGTTGVRASTVRPGNVRIPAVLRLGFHPSSQDVSATTSDPLARTPALARLEAILFLADEPVTLRRLTEVAEFRDARETRQRIEQLKQAYDASATAFQIEEIAGGYQLLTRALYHPWLLRLRRTGHDLRLTPAALETLAVIAYKQPIPRADIEAIRGVNCSELLRILMEKGWIRIAGRHASLGRPQLYGTSRKFLQVLGLNTLHDLPNVEAIPKPALRESS